MLSTVVATELRTGSFWSQNNEAYTSVERNILTLVRAVQDIVGVSGSVFKRFTLTNLFTEMNNTKTSMVNKEVNTPVCIVTVNIVFVSKFSIEYIELVRRSGRRTPDQFSYNVINGAVSRLPPALCNIDG